MLTTSTSHWLIDDMLDCSGITDLGKSYVGDRLLFYLDEVEARHSALLLFVTQRILTAAAGFDAGAAGHRGHNLR